MKQIMLSAKLHTIWIIWVEQNKQRFSNENNSMQSLFHKLIYEVHLSCNLIKGRGSSSMVDFCVTQLFKTSCSASIPHSFFEVVWSPPCPVGSSLTWMDLWWLTPPSLPLLELLVEIVMLTFFEVWRIILG